MNAHLGQNFGEENFQEEVRVNLGAMYEMILTALGQEGYQVKHAKLSH